jgi:predicted RNase H-like HicB family nuclease
MVRTFTAAVHQEEDWYIARCLELEVASQGTTVNDALLNLREAVEAYLDEVTQPTIESTPLVTSFQVGEAA